MCRSCGSDIITVSTTVMLNSRRLYGDAAPAGVPCEGIKPMSDSEARLWIDLATGQVDLSGSETFVKEVLPTIREMLSARSVRHEPHNGGREATNHDRRIEDSSDDRATAQRRRRAPSPIHVTPA